MEWQSFDEQNPNIVIGSEMDKVQLLLFCCQLLYDNEVVDRDWCILQLIKSNHFYKLSRDEKTTVMDDFKLRIEPSHHDMVPD